MKYLLFLLTLSFSLLVQAQQLELKNQFLQLKINNTGGRIERMYFVPARVNLAAGVGLLGDNFWNIADSRFFLTDLNYTPVPGKQSMELKAHHTGGGIDFMEVSKTIHLPPDAAMMTVDYKFTNLPAAMADLDYGFWSHNFVGESGRDYTYFFPCTKGISTVSSKNQSGELWFNQPSRGWTAFIDGNGAGMAMTMDYAHLKSFYGWYDKTGATQEWHLDKVKIPQGKSFDTTFEFIPFTGLKKVSGAGRGLVGEINIVPEKAAFQTNQWLKRDIAIKLHSAKKQKITLKITARTLPNGNTYDVATHEIQFDKPLDIKSVQNTFQFPVAAPAYDVEARAFDADGKLLAIFNTPVEISSAIAYNMLPEIERGKDKDIRLVDLTRLDSSVETPHINWARPLQGGKIKVLALTPYPSYRELAELTQRVDIELTSMVWTLPYKALFEYGPYYGVLTNEDVLANVDRLLTREYDVILLAGINWTNLTAVQRGEIVRKVKNGCGFVEIANNGKDTELAEISAFKGNADVGTAIPAKTRDGFLSTAIPFELFPPAIYRKGEADGDVFAASKGSPWVVQRQVEKGRSVGLGWYCGGGSGRMINGATPELPYPMPGAAFKEYFELYQLLMAKAIVAAAGREPAVRFDKISAVGQNNEVAININFAGTPSAPLKLTAFVRSSDNEELARKTFDLAPTATASVKLPAPPWGARHLLGLILADAEGKVIDFGAVALNHSSGFEIRGLKAERDLYAEGDTASFTVDVSKPGCELRWSLVDAYSRVVAAGTQQAQTTNKITAVIANNLKMRHYDFRAELLVNGTVADRRETAITVAPAPEKLVWDDYEPGIWITPRGADGIRPHMRPLLAEKLREMRMQTILANHRPLDITFATQFNFNPTVFQHAGTAGARVSPEYQKTGDKMLLIRKPCLSDPAFFNGQVEAFKKIGQECAPYAPRFYWFGDELSLSGYWSTPIDFCFSPTCLVHFREFLMKKYGSLAAINRQWGTDYKKLEDVLPETAAEARKHTDGNYGAWADHLEYMDGLLLEYINKITNEGLRSTDPGARTSISGPQAASAYGGNDWYRQTPIYSGMMSYDGGSLLELMRSFAPDSFNLPWFLGYDIVGGRVCYNLWRSLMFGARGAMAFHVPSLINPDFTLSESGQGVVKYLPEIVDGTGKLVLNALAERPAPEIMIVYSQPSIRSAFIEGRAKEHENLRWKYVMLCRNFGIPFRFVADDQIAKGLLAEIKPKLVVFPDNNALSDDCLKQVENYLRQGGKILTDGNFGGMDASCRIVKRKLPDSKSVLRVLKPSTGYYEAWNKSRLLRSESDWSALNNDRNLFAQVLGHAGIAPLCKVLQSDGAPFLDAEIDIMTDRQDNRYALVISREENPTEIKLEFSTPKYVRDIRGAGNKLMNSNPVFVALLPAEETAPLSLEASGSGRDFTLNIDASTKRDTVIRLTVTAPDGKEVQWYNANLNAPLGKAVHKLQFALNDQPGDWKIRAREIVSGREAETTIHFNRE